MDKAKDMEKTKVTAVVVTYNRKALLEKPFNYFIKCYFLWPLGIMRIECVWWRRNGKN